MNKTSVTLALTAALGTSGIVLADGNPFGMQQLQQGYMVAEADAKTKEGKCGEGKCGGATSTDASESKAEEGKCGGATPAAASEAKAKEGKCGEGKCGASK